MPAPHDIERFRTARAVDIASSDMGALRLATPVILLLIVAIIGVAGVLALTARDQDRHAAEQSVRMVQTALAQAAETLGATARDYANWDDAVEKLAAAPDADWADANIGSYMHQNFGIAASLVLTDDGATLLAFRDGVAVSGEGAPAADLSALAAKARSAPPGLSAPATGIVEADGTLFIAAAADLRGELTGERPGERADPGAVLLLLRRLDQPFLDRLAAPLLLTGMRVGAGEGAVERSALPLAGPDGKGRGRLAWDPPQPGNAFLQSARWLLLPMIGLMVALTALFLSRAQRAAGEQVGTALALRRSELGYQRLVDSMPDLVALVRGGRLELVNAGGAQMLGADAPAAIMGLAVADLVAEPDRADLADRLRARSGDGRTHWTPVQLLRRDGGALPAELALLPLGGGDGEVLVARDRREQEDARERLREAQAQAALADRAKGQFLSNISHELRTPLNAIIGFSEILRDELLGSLGSPQYRDYAIDIHEGGLHLLRLVNDLLDIARIDAGRLELREAWVDLPGLIDRCVRLVSQKATEHGVTVSSQVMPPAQRLLADEVRLKQTLVNLLTNAIRFSGTGDHVAVSAGTDEEGNFLLSVADHGMGMTPESVALALEPFGQVEGGHNRRQPGAGLGLPLAKGYVEAHGGGLTITSTLGVGTTVTITLPKSRLYQPVPARS